MVLAQPCKSPPSPASTNRRSHSAEPCGRGPCWSGAPASGPPSLPPRQLGTVSRYLHECEPASTAHCQRGKALTDEARRRFKATGSTKGDGSRLHLNQNFAELPSDSLNLTKQEAQRGDGKGIPHCHRRQRELWFRARPDGAR